MPLVPTKMADAQYSVSGNHWPRGPRDMFKTRSARKFKSCVFEPPTRRVFSINTSSSNPLFLFDQISSQQQHTHFRIGSALSDTVCYHTLVLPFSRMSYSSARDRVSVFKVPVKSRKCIRSASTSEKLDGIRETDAK